MTLPAEMPADMTAVEITRPGAPEVLRSATLAVPRPADGEVVIEVAAAGVNRPDVLQRTGSYPVPHGASPLPGLEVAGTVVGLADDVTALALGDTVCALVPGGGYAEYCATPAAHCLPVPAGMSMVQAAALPETFFTVWGNVFDRGRLTEGETILIHGGSSGIGTTTIQLARAFGARPITTVGSDRKADACRALGADPAINYRSADFVAAVLEATDGAGVDVVLDMVSGEYVARNIDCLRTGGRHVTIAALGGAEVTFNIAKMMIKRLIMTGSTLRPQSNAAKAAIAEQLRRRVWPLLEAGSVAPVIHATFPLAEAAAAHRLMETSSHIGKIVLEVR